MPFFYQKIDFFQKRRVAWQNGFKVETTCLSRSKPDRNQPMKICSSLKKSIFKKKKTFFCLFFRGGGRGYYCFNFLGRGVLHKEFLHIPKELSFHEKCFVLWTFYLNLILPNISLKLWFFRIFGPKTGNFFFDRIFWTRRIFYDVENFFAVRCLSKSWDFFSK